MKLLTSVGLLLMLLTFSQCHKKKNDPAPPTEVEKTTAILTSSPWSLKSLTIDGVADDNFFKGLTLTFTATGFTATNGDPIWPATGTWSFTDAGARKIKRGDNLEVTIESISDTGVTFSIQWDKTTTGGRTASVPGKHIFVLGK